MWWFTILLGVLLLGVGICLLRLNIHVLFVKDGSDDGLSLTFKTLWILRYTKRFPLDGEEAGKKRPDKKRKKELQQKKLKDKKIPPVNRLISVARSFLRINGWLIRHIKCTRFFWKTRIGFEDAAQAGLSSGALWGIKGIVLSFLHRTVDSENCKTEIDVTPVFCRQEFETRVDCIFNLRVGYIIIAGIRLVLLGIVSYLVLKGVRLVERPSN